ncbi:MAG: CHASE domain-containing protein [Cyanobacteriota bacterium]|nr:CHASE domain-containing protein [Cyanobacteriota bacterium]
MVKIVRDFNRLFHRLGEAAVKTKSPPPKRSYFTRSYLPVSLTFIFGLGLSLVGYGIAYQWEKAKAKVILEQRADNLAIALQNKIDNYIQVTQALAAFYNASDEVTRQDFLNFSQPFFENYPGITGMAWAPLVLNSERSAYEEMLKAEGFPNWRIHYREEKRQNIPVTIRDEYLPITYGVPLEIYQNIIGYDLFSYYLIKPETLEKVRKTSKTIATNKIALITDAEPAFILFKAIYPPNSPKDTPSTKTDNYFLGTAYTIYKISKIVEESLRIISIDDLDFSLLDESAGTEEKFLAFYDSSSGQIKEYLPEKKLLSSRDIWGLCREGNTCKRSLKLADRQWSILLLPTANFEDRSFFSETVITIGLLLTASLTFYLAISIKYTSELEAAMEKLKSTQAQLIQAEKMSGLGQLVAGVAHEINNPVSFIYGNIYPAKDYSEHLLKLLELYQEEYANPSETIQDFAADIDVDFIKDDLPKIIESMKIGAQRIQKIVLSLRNFSRLDESQVKLANIHEGIESTLIILKSRLTANGEKPEINIIKKYGNLPLLECYPGQLNQVFMNLIANGIDALEELRDRNNFTPTITISTIALANKEIIIKIEDNGPGIPEEILEDIFNPFFTTKPPGKGTGLGLSIAYSIIVEKHGGQLKCISQKGKGTEFTITIPMVQK